MSRSSELGRVMELIYSQTGFTPGLQLGSALKGEWAQERSGSRVND